jgi:glycosyltransferase involved in cell wall biosynthesis
MSATPAISILTPVWNGLPYLKECVESVLAQDFQDWEMIIADNASDDGTTEYLQSLKDPRIIVYRHPTNIGLYRNNNFLFNKANAKIYMGLCADDYLYEGALRKIVDEWSNLGPEIGLVTFNWKDRQQKQNAFDRLSLELLPTTLGGIDSEFAFFLFGCFPGNFSEVSGKVSLVRPEHYLYHIRYSADYEFWLRLVKKQDLRLSSSNVSYIRRHDKVVASYTITKGEYHEESVDIYNQIINELSPYSDREKLVSFYNIIITSHHLRVAIKSALLGETTALKSFLRMKSPIFWRFQALRCLPYALSEKLRFAVGKKLAKDIWVTRKAA